jgi:hypothetical protein
MSYWAIIGCPWRDKEIIDLNSPTASSGGVYGLSCFEKGIFEYQESEVLP